MKILLLQIISLFLCVIKKTFSFNFNNFRNLDESSICQVTTCGSEACNTYGSVCVDNKCSCNLGWDSSPTSLKKCCYKQYTQINAFLYEFFLGFGAGHFYCKRDLNGGFKVAFLLSFYGVIFILGCIKSYHNFKEEEEQQPHVDTRKIEFASQLLLGFFFLLWIAWQIADGVMFGSNYHKDGNNMTLEPW